MTSLHQRSHGLKDVFRRVRMRLMRCPPSIGAIECSRKDAGKLLEPKVLRNKMEEGEVEAAERGKRRIGLQYARDK